mgnify:CR=1 FL=1
MKIALIGATGMVGKVMMNLIQERKIIGPVGARIVPWTLEKD